MKIAIVGAGVAGSSVLRTLIEESPENMIDQVDVFDYRKETSRGLPYQEDDSTLLLNISADRISSYPDKSEDFVEWLKDKNLDHATQEGMVQRRHYGRYLHERFKSYFDHEKVHVYQSEVIDMLVFNDKEESIYQHSESKKRYRLQVKDESWTPFYDAVFFTIGHPPYADYYGLAEHPHFIRDPYPLYKSLGGLSGNQKVGIIGSGASSLDILRYLKEHVECDYPLPLYIQTTPFTPTQIELDEDAKPSRINERWIEEHRHSETGQIALADIWKQVHYDLKEHGADWSYIVEQFSIGDLSENIRQYYSQPRGLGVIQEYLSSLTHYLPDLYNALSMKDRQDYDTVYRPKVEHFRHTIPYETMGRVIDSLKKNKLRIVPGLDDIQWNEAKQVFDIYIDGNYHESCDVLVNGTGFEFRIKEAGPFNLLIHNLYQKGYITPADNESGQGIAVTWPECQLINQKFGQLDQVYLMGLFVHLTQYGNNNAQLNMKQGRRSAEHLIDRYQAHELLGSWKKKYN